jgi:hypothetical protein
MKFRLARAVCLIMSKTEPRLVRCSLGEGVLDAPHPRVRETLIQQNSQSLWNYSQLAAARNQL